MGRYRAQRDYDYGAEYLSLIGLHRLAANSGGSTRPLRNRIVPIWVEQDLRKWPRSRKLSWTGQVRLNDRVGAYQVQLDGVQEP